MKKIITVSFLALVLTISTGCTKTDVDLDLEQANKNQELLTEEEYNELSKEDQEFQEDYLNALMEATEEQRLDESIALIDELEESEAKKLTEGNARGSCNAIEDSSTCIEYYGSFWDEQEMKLNCSDSGVFSFGSCPVDMAGGCNTGMDTPADMVAWMYTRGDGEITTESLKYAKMACDATLASKWLISKK